MVLNRVIKVGETANGTAFVEIRWDTEEKDLALSGVIGPKSNGEAKGSCGQIDLMEQEWAELEPPFNKFLLRTLQDVWDAYHLNHMKAGCVHQRQFKWEQLSRACPICGYAYGTRWRSMEVPADVIDWLFSFPDARHLMPTAWRPREGDLAEQPVGIPTDIDRRK